MLNKQGQQGSNQHLQLPIHTHARTRTNIYQSRLMSEKCVPENCYTLWVCGPRPCVAEKFLYSVIVDVIVSSSAEGTVVTLGVCVFNIQH